MATTKRSLTARVAAGLGAAAFATLTVLGGALPASAAPNIVAPTDPPPSITIHKHEQPAVPGPVGTGSPTDPVAGDPIDGVVFTIERVESLDVFDNADWAMLPTLTATDVIDDDVAYPLGAPVTATTGADGVGTGAVTTVVELGVYLVREFSTPAGAGIVIESAPFLVVVPQPQVVGNVTDWNYNVHVYPKNTVANVVKSTPPAVQQGLGSTVPWTITTNAPIASQGTAVTSYAIQDVLDPRLDYVEDSAVVTVGGSTLTTPTDYTITPLAGAGGTLVVNFTDPAGLQALEDANGGQVVLTFDTTVVSLTAPGEPTGVIDNIGSVFVNDSQIDSNTVTDYWGGIEIKKVDDDAQNAEALEGATFRVYLPTDTAFANPIAINGVSMWTSDSNGIVTIHGLRTNQAGTMQYVVREEAAPAGYTLGDTTSWTLAVAPGTDTEVELTVVNPQVPPYQLPVTGGSGEAAFMIGGLGLIGAALGFVLIRRRKEQAEA